jgi:hypothetical protein
MLPDMMRPHIITLIPRSRMNPATKIISRSSHTIKQAMRILTDMPDGHIGRRN